MHGKLSKEALFKWDDAQCFISMDGSVATSYTNEHITITFVQNADGELTHFAYETTETFGEVTVSLKETKDDT